MPAVKIWVEEVWKNTSSEKSWYLDPADVSSDTVLKS